MKVLIIEDNDDMSCLLKQVTQETMGIGTDWAFDGESALKLIQDGCEPDLILLDLHLPGISGWDIFNALREKTKSKIAVVTADLDVAPEFTEKADAVFVKPVHITELIIKLHSLLSESAEVRREE